MPITTEYLKLNKPLYTEAADIEVINGNMDIVEEAVKDIHGRQKRRLLYITESQEFTIPEAVYEIDVYLVNGGFDGVVGTEMSLGAGFAKGGAGGAGGGCFLLPGLRVSPGSAHNIIIGAGGGGTTYFDNYGAEGVSTAGGIISSSNSGDMTARVGKFPVLYGQLNGCACPLDGNYYGVSGAAGGCSYASQSDGQTMTPGVGGEAAVIGASGDTPPQGGKDGHISWLEYGSAADNFCGGGGGGSFDNKGENGRASTKSAGTYHAGAGANATTYGCGGGGAAGGFTSYMRAGVGGKGAQGVCIIAY